MSEVALIDDDPLVRLNWKRQGQHANLVVHTFDTFDSFLQVSSGYSSLVPIYIDSQLGDFRGEELSETLIKLGFKKITLTTGLPETRISNKKWVSRIVGKSFDSAVLGKQVSLS